VSTLEPCKELVAVESANFVNGSLKYGIKSLEKVGVGISRISATLNPSSKSSTDFEDSLVTLSWSEKYGVKG